MTCLTSFVYKQFRILFVIHIPHSYLYIHSYTVCITGDTHNHRYVYSGTHLIYIQYRGKPWQGNS